MTKCSGGTLIRVQLFIESPNWTFVGGWKDFIKRRGQALFRLNPGKLKFEYRDGIEYAVLAWDLIVPNGCFCLERMEENAVEFEVQGHGLIYAHISPYVTSRGDLDGAHANEIMQLCCTGLCDQKIETEREAYLCGEDNTDERECLLFERSYGSA